MPTSDMDWTKAFVADDFVLESMQAAIVEAIITELGLAKAANTRIGALNLCHTGRSRAPLADDADEEQILCVLESCLQSVSAARVVSYDRKHLPKPAPHQAPVLIFQQAMRS